MSYDNLIRTGLKTLPNLITPKKSFRTNAHTHMLCILTSNAYLRMRSHGRKQWKMFENYQKSTFFIVRTRDSNKAQARTSWNCWGATSFWVSTSVWESLLNTKKLNFSSCPCMSLMWVSRAYDEKITFLIIFKHF